MNIDADNIPFFRDQINLNKSKEICRLYKHVLKNISI